MGMVVASVGISDGRVEIQWQQPAYKSISLKFRFQNHLDNQTKLLG